MFAKMPERVKRLLRPPYLYSRFHARATLQRLAEWRSNDYRDPLPIPPPLLRHRVHGTFDAGAYLDVGRRCAQDIKDLVESVHQSLYSFNSILDFGCGSGRVIRHFHDRPPSCHVCGTDIDDQSIRWCRKNLPFARFETNGAMPPTRYPDGTFDFVYGISVFTHLNEDMQFAWLTELKRIARPEALLLLSVHGRRDLPAWSEEDQAVIARQGFLYKVAESTAFRLHRAQPGFYQRTQHSRRYIEDNWSRLFRIVRYVEAGINNHQDAVLLANG
jgi:SAM-dependent methyltransferase